MTIEASHLSHEEYVHLNGALSAERTEQILSEYDEAIAMDVREFAPYAQEARAGFAEEDFLQEDVNDLYAFAKRLRGENKKDLLSYIEAIEFKLQELRNSVEYGNEQLSKIISTIKRN